MSMLAERALTWSAIALAGVVMAGCASPNHRAPVEDRHTGTNRGAPTAAAPVPSTGSGATAPADPAKPLPGIENAGKPGYYTIKPGDTLIRVGMDNGYSYRDIARWNNIDNPNLIEVGQVVRVVPPGVDPSAPATRPVAVAKVETRALDAKPAGPAAAASGAAPAASAGTAGAAPAASTPSAAAPAATLPAPAASAGREPDDDINWMWPAAGSLLGGFEEPRSKGLSIGGKAGDPVLAAADGRVIYAGSGIRGYGNLIIVKHNNTYLTAYGHNQTLLVKEDQVVRRGQKIAEMGSSDAERVQLHFEIRRMGKPVDPARLLPAR
jgi:lipoprotein NlpD